MANYLYRSVISTPGLVICFMGILVCYSQPSSTVDIIPRHKTVFWGPWSSWSACSSSCGQGIAKRTRECRRFAPGKKVTVEPWNCEGRESRLKVCRSQPCENVLPVIDEECHELQQALGGSWRQTNLNNTCSTQCAEEKSQKVRTVRTAPDGQSCRLDGLPGDTKCRSGQCEPVVEGCLDDRGRFTTYDMCLICGGKNQSCYLVEGNQWKPVWKDDSPLGVVVWIPQGSTLIHVETTRGEKHSLVVEDYKGSTLLPPPSAPHLKSTFSYSGKAEGATWLHELSGEHEILTSTGPTIGGVMVKVSRQPGVDQKSNFRFWALKSFSLVSKQDDGDDDGDIVDKRISSETAPSSDTTSGNPKSGLNSIIFLSSDEIISPSQTPVKFTARTAAKLPQKTTESPRTFRPGTNNRKVGNSTSESNSEIDYSHRDKTNFETEKDNVIKPTDSRIGIDDADDNKLSGDLVHTNVIESDRIWFPTDTGVVNNNVDREHDNGDNKVTDNVITRLTPGTERKRPDRRRNRPGAGRQRPGDNFYIDSNQVDKDQDRSTPRRKVPNSTGKSSKRRDKKNKKKKKARKMKQKIKEGKEPILFPEPEDCFPCPRAKNRAEQFCSSDFVSKVYVNRRRYIRNETRYDVTVMSSYRNSVSLMQREFIWVESLCRCPNLKAKRTYIVMGRMKAYTDREARLVVEPGSFIRGYSLGQDRKIHRLGRMHVC